MTLFPWERQRGCWGKVEVGGGEGGGSFKEFSLGFKNGLLCKRRLIPSDWSDLPCIDRLQGSV